MLVVKLLLFSIISSIFSIQSHSATPPFSILHSPSLSLSLSLSVLDFNATASGLHYDTHPIQSTIDACAAAAPPNSTCHVIFPPGGTKLEDYPEDPERWYVVLAEDAEDVGVIGEGEINGQGLEFVKRFDAVKNVMVSWNSTGRCLGDECRPRLVGFVGCNNVVVSGVKLNQPAYWCLHLVRCQNTTIQDVSIFGDFNTPNNDGIDIEASNNTLITRCIIDTGDDAICPKSLTGPVYNITATDSWIRTKSSAIKLGSASFFTFKGFVFNNLTIFESHRGLGFQIRDGGNVSDITFSNINISTRYYDPSWWGRAEPIYVTTCPRDNSSKAGSISNIKFINITSTSENGVFLSGSGGGLLSHLKFLNVNLTFKRWTNYTDGLLDYRPGCQELVSHDSAGFMMEHIDGLHLENVNVKWSGHEVESWNNPLDFRPATVDNIILQDFHSNIYTS